MFSYFQNAIKAGSIHCRLFGTRGQPFRLWRISYGLPLTSELDALCAEDANPTVREAHGVASLFAEE